MKTQKIRHGFETNSSSSHSICIGYGVVEPEYKSDTIELVGGEFGWGYDSYNGPGNWYMRANYAATYAKGNERHEEMLNSVLKEILKVKEVVWNFTLEWDKGGNVAYIDHQSQDVCAEAFESEDNLTRFIFANSELIIDNDNY